MIIGADGDDDNGSSSGSAYIYTFPFIDDDNDGVTDWVDNCDDVFNPNQSDLDNDSKGDSCDLDIDGDGFSNNIENKFGSDPTNDSDTSSLLNKILAYSNQDDPQKNVPFMDMLGLFLLSVTLLLLRIWGSRK